MHGCCRGSVKRVLLRYGEGAFREPRQAPVLSAGMLLLRSEPLELNLLGQSRTLSHMPPDRTGFDAFVNARQADLLRLAFVLSGELFEAQDLVQSTLVKVWLKWKGIRHDDPYAYARRVLANEFTRQRRKGSSSELPVPTVIDAPAPYSGFSEDALVLRSALMTLPPRSRAVVVLRYREDLSEKQTADLLGMSLGTAKSHASRGLAALRDALGDDRLVYEGDNDD